LQKTTEAAMVPGLLWGTEEKALEVTEAAIQPGSLTGKTDLINPDRWGLIFRLLQPIP